MEVFGPGMSTHSKTVGQLANYHLYAAYPNLLFPFPPKSLFAAPLLLLKFTRNCGENQQYNFPNIGVKIWKIALWHLESGGIAMYFLKVQTSGTKRLQPWSNFCFFFFLHDYFCFASGKF